MIMRSIFTQASVQLHFLCFCFHSVILFLFLFFCLAFFTIAIVKQPHYKRISLHIHPVLHPIQSRTQSLQAFWSAGQRREDSGDIEKIQFF